MCARQYLRRRWPRASIFLVLCSALYISQCRLVSSFRESGDADLGFSVCVRLFCALCGAKGITTESAPFVLTLFAGQLDYIQQRQVFVRGVRTSAEGVISLLFW